MRHSVRSACQNYLVASITDFSTFYGIVLIERNITLETDYRIDRINWCYELAVRIKLLDCNWMPFHAITFNVKKTIKLWSNLLSIVPDFHSGDKLPHTPRITVANRLSFKYALHYIQSFRLWWPNSSGMAYIKCTQIYLLTICIFMQIVVFLSMPWLYHRVAYMYKIYEIVCINKCRNENVTALTAYKAISQFKQLKQLAVPLYMKSAGWTAHMRYVMSNNWRSHAHIHSKQ